MMSPSLRLVSPQEGALAGDPDERPLIDALRARRLWAERAVLERFTPVVRRVLFRLLRSSDELDDLTQEVFLRALERIALLRDGVRVQSWLTGFAVLVARETLRKRARRRWLVLFAPADLPEAPLESPTLGTEADALRALQATYELLDQMAIDARTAFVLRHFEGMELVDVASACGVSLATIKRRLERAERTFLTRARRHPLLQDLLGGWLDERRS